MTMKLRKLARTTTDVFEFIRLCQDTKLTGCTGARELAGVWYRVRR